MNTRFILALLLFFVCRSVFAQQSSPSFPPTDSLPSVRLPPELDRVLRDYEREWGAGHTEKLVALFALDGFVLQPRRPAIQGQEQLKKAYQNQGGAPLFLRALSYAQDGSVGYIIGAYRSAAHTPDIGKFILALRKGKDGRWLIAADMDNSAK